MITINKTRVSPHGGYLVDGTVSSGTLRTQDLLRAFADEYERLVPFNSFSLVNEARSLADALDRGEECADASEVVEELREELDDLARRRGFYFGTTEGDGADFGFWPLEDDAEEEFMP